MAIKDISGYRDLRTYWEDIRSRAEARQRVERSLCFYVTKSEHDYWMANGAEELRFLIDSLDMEDIHTLRVVPNEDVEYFFHLMVETVRSVQRQIDLIAA